MEYSLGAAGPQFDPFLEKNTIAERWRAWRRNFQYYLDGQIGLNDRQKLARLLHQAGPDVQEIYETLRETDAEGNTELEKCINRLNTYFDPTVNRAIERQKFRNTTRNEGESMENYMMRLIRQSKYCGFTDEDEAICDQIIEKCDDIYLKRKFIKKGVDLTPNKILEICRMYELEKSVVVASQSVKHEENNSGPGKCEPEINKVQAACYRCGRRGHYSTSRGCPALEVKCDKCGIKGHFSKCCKTKTTSKKTMDNNKKKKRYIKYVIESASDSGDDGEEYTDNEKYEEEEGVNSVFGVNSSKVDCKYNICIGTDKIHSCKFIIDSGASINIIDKNTFKKLIKAGFVCKLNTVANQKYFAYGGKELSQVGTFKVILHSPDTNQQVETQILVYKGHGPSLLSRQTSTQLGLLRVGPVNHVSSLLQKDDIIQKYPGLFEGVGKLEGFKLKIPIDPNIKLVAQPVIRTPFNVRNVEQELINELLKNDIIEPVTGPTPCVSPSHLVAKKEEGQYRLVVDMRKANEAVLRERVPLPTFEELLDDLNGCKYFSSIDIKWGYHQIELDEKSREITVFSTSLGLFRYKRLFFGIRCASEMFQRIIAHLLQGIDGVANSQDDIRIGGRTIEEHNARLLQVLDRLHAKGITLNEKKCSFGVTNITFLGHHLSADGIRPTLTSQKVIQDFRAPKDKTEVRSFLGLANFSARFIPNFSTLTEPLRNLTKKDTEFIWTDEHETAFQQLKNSIAKAPALGYYDKNAETTLVTDASPVGIAAVLIQHQNIKGELQPVVIKYASKTLSPTEQRYSQTEKEALAIVWACENLYMYLIGKQFNIISDHKPLEIIYSPNSKPSARIQRWVLRLQPYTFKVIHRPGKTNIADPVSRLLKIDESTRTITEDIQDSALLSFVEVKAVTLEDIQEATQEDDELVQLKEAIFKDSWTKELKRYELIKTELCVVDNIILRGTRIVIPKKLVSRILEAGHEGHLAKNSMKAKLRQKVWWKGMDSDIEYWTDTCEGCRLVRQNVPPEPLTTTELPSRVWQTVAIDYLGPLPSGHYLLFVVDYYSRYFEVEILNNQTADTTIMTLEKIIAREGLMEEIVCDNGPAFRDQKFKEFLQYNNIKLRHTTPLWPQANGEVERQNRNVLRRLRIAQGLKKDWRKELLTYLLAYRTTPHSSTGLPPGNVFRGRNLRTKIPELLEDKTTGDEEMRDNDRYKKNQFKQYADNRRHAKDSNLKPGDKVLVKQRKENKLSTTFSPTEHTIIWKSGNSVAAQGPDGNVIRRNSSYFLPIRDRDMSRFDCQQNSKEKESDRESTDMNLETNESSLTMTNKDLTDAEMCNEKTQRTRRMPTKYKDFVLGLILECDHINKII